MSRFTRYISRSLREMENTSKWYHKVYDAFCDWWDYSALSGYYYNFKAFIKNVCLFTRLAWMWRPWDSHYTILALTKLLEEQAKCLRNGMALHREKYYRRCLTAAGKIDRAYNRPLDKTISYLLDKNPIFPKELDDGMFTLETNYNTSKDLYDGIYSVAEKRADNAEKQAKKDAWDYLLKHIETFWD